MLVRDIMTTELVKVGPETTVGEIARLLVAKAVSAVPVVEGADRLVGIVSESDLIRRLGDELPERASWWLELLASPDKRAAAYLKVHGRTAREVMTSKLVTIDETATIAEAVRQMETNRVKRLPVMRRERLRGLVSRADLVRLLTVAAPATGQTPDDQTLRDRVVAEIEKAGLSYHPFVNIVVTGGKVQLWGFVDSATIAEAMTMAARNVEGVTELDTHLTVRTIPAAI